MRIAPGLAALKVTASMMGREMTIYPTVFWDDRSALLVDTGLPGQAEALKEALAEEGVPMARVNQVILTHQDVDHIGGLPSLLAQVEHPIEVLAHAADVPYIQGERPLIKMDPERTAKMLASLPEEQRKAVAAALSTPPKAKVDRTLEDGERLNAYGGIKVIFTPGHTPGHISLYHEASRTLVTADALRAEDGRLSLPQESNTPDMDRAMASVKRLAELQVDHVVCYHGGVISEDADNQLKGLASKAG